MDWIKLISELQAAGVSQGQIAATCGCSQANISELRTGKTKRPSHQLGEAIKAMHRKMQRRQQQAA